MFEGSSFLLDILAMIIAFSVVMLLLSIVVTALAQATQAALRLRARNLQRGLAAVLERELPIRKDESRQFAANLLNSPEIAQLRRRGDPNSFFGRVQGPIVSWLEPETLREALVVKQENDSKREGADSDSPSQPETKPRRIPEAKPLPPETNVESVVTRFTKIDKLMSKRFGVAMRTVSVCWAVVVAAAFQISTPDLLQQLSTDPEHRMRIAALAPQMLESGEAAIARLADTSQPSAKALSQLLDKHPELRSQVEQVSSAAEYPEGVAEQLSALVETVSDRAAIVAEFEELLDQELVKQRDTAVTEATAAIDQLGRINVAPWRYGSGFYLRDGTVRFGNILGILITAILLTLGAPFWFNTLKQSLALKDVLSRRDDDGKDQNRNESDKR